MSAAPKRRLEALSEQLAAGIPSEGEFEDIPRIRHVATASPTEPRLRGKVAIVTGANSATGIGRAAAHQFAAHGATAVYLCDWATEHLATHRRELAELYPGVRVETRQLDVGDEAAVRAVCEHAVRTYGRLDVMFANAGIIGSATTFEHITPDEWTRTMRVNALGVFLCAKHAAAAMKVVGGSDAGGKEFPGGSIIATASVAGLRSNAGATDYSASKAAVISIAQTLAYQLAGTGIRVNALCPGVIETGMTKPMYDVARQRGTERKIGQLNPLRRGAVADEVARVALFLASDEASYVTGQAWAVDGGLSAGHPFVPGKIA